MTEPSLHNEDPSVVEIEDRYYLVTTQDDFNNALRKEIRRAVDEGRLRPEDKEDHIQIELLRFIDAGITPSDKVLATLVDFNTLPLEKNAAHDTQD